MHKLHSNGDNGVVDRFSRPLLGSLEVYDPITGPAFQSITVVWILVFKRMFHLNNVGDLDKSQRPAIEITGAEGEIDGLDVWSA